MARKKKKRKYTRRANATKAAATRRGKKKRKYTKRAEATAPKRKYTRRADKAASLHLPELLRAGLEQVQTQIQERTEQLIAAAVGTEAPSVSAMLTEAAKQADSDPMTKNLLLIRANIQNALSVLENLNDKPRRGRKAKVEKIEDVEGTDDADIDVEDEEPKKVAKVHNIKKDKTGKKAKKPAKAASVLRKKTAEAAEG